MIKAILYTDIREKKKMEYKMFSKLTPAEKRKAIKDWKDVMSRIKIVKEKGKRIPASTKTKNKR